MADYLKRTLIVVAVGLVAGGLAMLPAAGQSPEESAENAPEASVGGELIGVIPGTDMLRDEFRARAMVQLKVVAISALTYRLLHDDVYPPDLATLSRSESWGFDLLNIFSGRPVQAVYFEPQKDDYTTRPVFDIPMTIQLDTVTMGSLGTEGALDLESLGQTLQELSLNSLPRVDAGRIRFYTPGDVFYFVSGDLLQLVMYAPDGSYIEHVDQAPNGNWRAQLATPGGSLWPDSVLAAQVLYFTGELLLRHHNLVEFMGERETLPPARFADLGAAERINMALDLGIVVLNPFARQPAMAVAEYALGDFYQLDPGTPLPLRICMRDGAAWDLDALHEETAATARDAGHGAAEGPSRPPLGGRK